SGGVYAVEKILRKDDATGLWEQAGHVHGRRQQRSVIGHKYLYKAKIDELPDVWSSRALLSAPFLWRVRSRQRDRVRQRSSQCHPNIAGLDQHPHVLSS